jgi:hypothetical protein
VHRRKLASYEGGADHDGAHPRPRDIYSGPTLGKKVSSPTLAAKVMTSRSELGSCCRETLRKFPEPQAVKYPDARNLLGKTAQKVAEGVV